MADMKEKERATKRRRNWFILSILIVMGILLVSAFVFLPGVETHINEIGAHKDFSLPANYFVISTNLFLNWWWAASVGSLLVCFFSSRGFLDPVLKLLTVCNVVFILLLLIFMVGGLMIPGRISIGID